MSTETQIRHCMSYTMSENDERYSLHSILSLVYYVQIVYIPSLLHILCCLLSYKCDFDMIFDVCSSPLHNNSSSLLSCHLCSQLCTLSIRLSSNKKYIYTMAHTVTYISFWSSLRFILINYHTWLISNLQLYRWCN